MLKFQGTFRTVARHTYDLLRLGRLTGIFLLYIPCLWGLIVAVRGMPPFKDLLLFFLGTFCMRSAGCIYNDMVDRDFDRLVLRTSMRPLATGALSLFYALAVMACLLLGALLVFWQLNRTAQTLALVNALFVFPYPWLKRFFNFPQLYLGLIFNGGVWVGFAQLGSFSYGVLIPLCLLYGSGIAWTLIYDTIYALQDVQDDEKIGLLSTALFFERRPRFFLLSCTLALLGLLWLLGWYYGFGIVYKSGLLISAVFLGVASLIAQKMALSNLSRLFSLCQLVGWLITLTLLIGFWMLRSP